MKKDFCAGAVFLIGGVIAFGAAGNSAVGQTPVRPPGRVAAPTAGKQPAVINYYYALPEDDADGVDFDERDEALRQRAFTAEVRNGFLRVGKVTLRVFHRKGLPDLVAVLNGDDGDSLHFLRLERVKVDARGQVHDAEWTNETKSVLPPDFDEDWKCQLLPHGDAIALYKKGQPIGNLYWTGRHFALLRGGAGDAPLPPTGHRGAPGNPH